MNPRVSVIVPVRNRRGLLVNLLDGLEKQTFRDFETIIVDDGSTDGADQEVLDRQRSARGLSLLRSNGAGAVAARRLGSRNSRGEILAFTDSDCIPDSQWLESGVRAIDGGAEMVNGLTLPKRPIGPLERSMGSATEGLYPTCNMFFSRACYDRFGGFDESAVDRLRFRLNERARGTGFGEDTILAWRMIRAGVPYAHAPDALVHHHVFEADPIEWLSRGVQMAAFPALVREVPELRNTLLRYGVFLGPSIRLPVYATAVALVSRRKSVVSMAALWWLAATLRRVRSMGGTRRSKAVWGAAEMALDALVAGALVTGSARARTLVL